MRSLDIIWLALAALWQRKVRSLLTMIGVAVGAYVLIMSLSIGLGVQEVIQSQLRKQDQMRRIMVWPGGRRAKEPPAGELDVAGEMSAARRERLREAIRRRWESMPIKPDAPPPRGLKKADLAALEKLSHVEALRPALVWEGDALPRDLGTARPLHGWIMTGGPEDPFYLRRLVAGRYFEPGEEGLLVSEFAAYRWGLTNEADVDNILGKRLRVEIKQEAASVGSLLYLLNLNMQELKDDEKRVLGEVIKRLPEAIGKMNVPEKDQAVLSRLLTRVGKRDTHKSILDLPVVGVFRDVSKTEIGPFDLGPGRSADVVVPPEVSRRLFYSFPGRVDQGLPQVQVRIDHEKNLREAEKEIKALGHETFSLAEVIEQVQLTVTLISLTCTFIAIVALAVAALGIINTMLMSVMERTHEIGVMKAVGARDAQVLALFLTESGMIGAIGAMVGLLAALASTVPGDRLAQYLVAKQSPMRLEESVFAFPLWLVLGIPGLVTLLTTLAGLYPARRAARVDPVEALRQR